MAKVKNDKYSYLAKHDPARSYSKLGEVLSIEKKYGAAVEYLHQAGVILEEISAVEPRHEGYKYTLANNYARLAAALEGMNDLSEAVRKYLNYIEHQEKLSRGDNPNNMPVRAIAIARQELGRVYEKLNRPQNAINSYQKSVEMFSLLEQKGALGEYDKQNFQVSRRAVERLQTK